MGPIYIALCDLFPGEGWLSASHRINLHRALIQQHKSFREAPYAGIDELPVSLEEVHPRNFGSHFAYQVEGGIPLEGSHCRAVHLVDVFPSGLTPYSVVLLGENTHVTMLPASFIHKTSVCSEKTKLARTACRRAGRIQPLQTGPGVRAEGSGWRYRRVLDYARM